MHRFLFLAILISTTTSIFAQEAARTNHKTLVRRPHDFAKVHDAYHPDTNVTNKSVFLGKMPVLWVNKGIAKKKMTCAMMGGDIIFLNVEGEWEAYASFTPDFELLKKHLEVKSKFTLVEKFTISYGTEGYQSEPTSGKMGEITNPTKEGDKVYVEAKIPGISGKRFRVTNVNDTQFMLCSDDDSLTSVLIQVK